MPAWQVKSRTGFNGRTSDDSDSPVDPESVMDMSRQPGSWRMVETMTVAPTPRRKEFRRTGSDLDGIPVYHVVGFQLYFGRPHLVLLYSSQA